MKQRIYGIIIGFLVSSLLFGTIVIAAPATTWKKIDVAYGDYKIYVDGELFEATDKNGVIESFSYNGWIYAPFEHIARALGKTASWDGNTHSLYLGTKPSVTGEYMTDVCPAYQCSNKDYYKEYSKIKSGNTENFKMAGVTYSNGFTFQKYYNDDIWAVYNLGGNYKKLSATLCHVDGKGTNKGTFKIFLDNELYKEIPISADMAPLQLDVNITGVKQLKLVLITELYGTTTMYGIGNPVLSK